MCGLINQEQASLVAQLVKNLPAMWETWVRSLGLEDPLDEGITKNTFIYNNLSQPTASELLLLNMNGSRAQKENQCFFKKNFYLFCFWLCWVFLAARVFFSCSEQSERVTGRKARGLQMEEIACKCQTFLSLLSGRRKQTSNIFFLLYTNLKRGFS